MFTNRRAGNPSGFQSRTVTCDQYFETGASMYIPRDKSKEVTVFYDGSCPLCVREIGFYRKCRNAGAVDWVDVSQCAGNTVAPRLSKADAMARFHVVDAGGRLVSGGDAFREVWRVLPAFRIWSRLFRARPLAWFLNRAYDLFLTVRPAVQSALLRLSKCRAAR